MFALQAGFCLVALAIGFFVLRETPRHRVGPDLPGSLSLALGVAGLMFALGQLRDRSLDSPWVLGALAVGASGLVLFWQVEQRVANPLLPLALLRQGRGFLAPLLANALTSASYMGAFAIAPYLLQRGFGLSITATATVLLLRTATFSLGSPLGGALGVRLGERSAAWIGCLVMVVGIGVLALGSFSMHFVAVAAGLLLQGLGYGLGTPSISSAASNAGHEDDIGITAAVSRMLGSIGSAFGVTLLTLLYGGNDAPRALATAFAAGGALALGAWIAALAMKVRRAHPLPR